jgi:excinuclease ABC subunit A
LSNLNPPIIDSDKTIKIRGAREHNLQNIDLDIPIGKTIALTGVSGSGKSTIARDILFSEGQRRYLDCLSPYAQQFVQELKRPDIDALEDIPPSIYVSQHISQPNALSTLGTMTEVYNFLRLLYVKVGTQFCIDHPTQPIQGGSLNDIVGQVRAFSSQSVRILSPIIVKKKGSHKGVFEKAIASEINEVRVNGVFYKPSTLLEGLERNKVHSIDFVVAKLEASRTDDDLILSAVSLALTHGSSQAIVTDGTKDTILSLNRMCPICSRGYLKLDPEDLSFHSKRGRCPCCSGFGSLQSETLCPRCNGTRLNPVGNSVKIREKSVGELTSMGAFGVREFLENLELREHHKKVAAPIIIEIMARLNHIIGLGLGSIPLNRSSKSVSGGELQRLRLASAMGSPLSGVLYILDEPSAGLHPADNKQVLQQINQIKDGGNTVVVIEHDPTTIKACEHLIVIGPGGGKNGGSVVFEGASTDLVAQSLNSQLLSVVPLNGSQFELLDKPIPYKRDSEKNSIESISITGTKRNIKDLKLSIPLGQLVVIAGVSGAGKSTLIHDMLSETIKSGKKSNEEYILDKSSVVVPPNLERIITIDQNPIGSHCRSIPASYLKIWDEIRKLFASTIEAKTLGWTPADFSFNTGKGRCSECKGLGTITLNMSFVSTANMICEACEGKRFIDDIQRVVYNKLSINDVLSLTFGQARDLFVAHPKIHRFLSLACDLGLDYLSLGQNSSTLSGGESQRIKLVQELANKKLQRTLYLLDEPTIGLHRSDVARLISVLQSLVDRGHSVIVIEHDQDLILASDHIIELGPSAGDNGGKVIFQGTPKELYGRDTPWGRELGNG